MTHGQGPAIPHGLFFLAIGLFCTACAGPDPAKISAENDRLRRQNLDLTRKTDELEKKVGLLEAQIDTLAQRLQTKAGLEGVAAADLPTAVKIEFDRYSGAYDTDGDGAADTLRVYVQTLDQRGRFVPVAGRAVLQAVAITPDPPPVVLASRVFAPAEFDDAYRSGFTGTHYTLEAKLPSPMPQGVREATVKVSVTDAATGAVLTGQQVMKLEGKLLLNPQVGLGEQRLEPQPRGLDVLAGPLLAVDDGDNADHFAAGILDRLGRLQHLAPGGGHVLDDDHALARLQLALQLLGCAVVLLLVADQDRGYAARQGRGGDQGDATQLGPGQAIDGAGVGDPRREPFAQRRQDVRLRLEQVLVQVVMAHPPAAQRKRATQQGRLAEALDQFGVGHGGQYRDLRFAIWMAAGGCPQRIGR